MDTEMDTETKPVTETKSEEKGKRPRQLTFRLLDEKGDEAENQVAKIEVTNITTKKVMTIALNNIVNADTLNYIVVYGLKQIIGDYRNTQKNEARDEAIGTIIQHLCSAEGLPKTVRQTKTIDLDKLTAGMDETTKALIKANYQAMIIKQ